MSRAEDRIPVPTNGHRPPLAIEPATAPGSIEAGSDVPALASRRGVAIDATPAQLVVGLGVAVGALLLVLGRRRRR